MQKLTLTALLTRFFNWRRRIGQITIRNTIFILLLFKIFYTFYGVFIFGKISDISDADGYLAAPIILSTAVLKSNTVLLGTITAILKSFLFVGFFVHLAYSMISFFCLKFVIDALKLTRSQEYFLILMLIMPTFGTWTSIIVKESPSCSLSCIVLVWIINLLDRSKLRLPLIINIVCLYFTLILRPIVGFSLVCLISTLYAYRFPILNKYVKFFFIVAFVAVTTIGAVALTSDYIKDEFIPLAEYYFNPKFATSTASSRPLGFWKSTADFYLKAPEGIFLANLGPTLFESLQKPLYIPYFFEGLFFIFTCIFLILSNIYFELRRAVVNPDFLFVILFGIILVLLLNYPFGVFNAGSALRYRSSYYHIIIILLLYFYSREKKLEKLNMSNI